MDLVKQFGFELSNRKSAPEAPPLSSACKIISALTDTHQDKSLAAGFDAADDINQHVIRIKGASPDCRTKAWHLLMHGIQAVSMISGTLIYIDSAIIIAPKSAIRTIILAIIGKLNDPVDTDKVFDISFPDYVSFGKKRFLFLLLLCSVLNYFLFSELADIRSLDNLLEFIA